MGFLTNATNPKATLFFLAIFTTIVSPGTPMLIQIGFGVWMCATTAIWFCLVSLLFSTVRVRLQFERLGHWFERVMGTLLLLLAARLLVSG
jgi:threonine/homoserine/homoserine lactone efflux protein